MVMIVVMIVMLVIVIVIVSVRLPLGPRLARAELGL